MRFLTLALLMTVFTLPAAAQNNDMRAVISRLDQMQRQMDTISRQVYRGETPPEGAVSNHIPSDNAGLVAAMDERMNSIEGSIRQLTNRLDEQDYAISQFKQQFDLFKGDAEMRFQELSQQAAQAVTPQSGTQATEDVAVISNVNTANSHSSDLPNDNPAAMYDSAFQALREQKYDRAETSFKEFLARYPNDALAGNAQYWLGETHYVRGNYQEAAKIFAQGFQKYPKNNKAPDNLLKLGLSLAQTDKVKEACLTFSQLGMQYPTAPAVIKQRAESESKKLNCGQAEG